MSHCPGTRLEDWLTDWFRIVVDGNSEYGDSIRNLYANQLILNKEQFDVLVKLFEPAREHIELWCERYNEEENGSWRDYCSVFDIPDDITAKAEQYLKQLRESGVELTRGLL
jgi:hypothetical protein